MKINAIRATPVNPPFRTRGRPFHARLAKD